VLLEWLAKNISGLIFSIDREDLDFPIFDVVMKVLTFGAHVLGPWVYLVLGGEFDGGAVVFE